MRHILLYVSLFFPILLFAASDTTQKTIPNRRNSPQTLEKPYLILISSDGFRYDYTKKYGAKNLRAFSEEGIQSKYLLPSFPSVTFPNHYTIATGLYPSHHGIVNNKFWDIAKNDFYTMEALKSRDSSWYGGIPIWGLAEQQGMMSASLFWVGSESNAGGMRPSYYYHYHNEFSHREKVDKVIKWLQLPEAERPHLITLYFPEVDGTGHFYGPDSKEVKERVQQIDSTISYLVKEVKKLSLTNVNFIFLSDHGMIKVDNTHPLPIPKAIDEKDFGIINTNTLMHIYARTDSAPVLSLYNTLKKEEKNYTAYLKKDVPEHLHYGQQDDTYNRVGDIVLLAKSPKIFSNHPIKAIGKHGYDPKKIPEMRAVFYAWGPAFKKHYKHKSVKNVDIYPLMAKLLQLVITEKIDGNLENVQKILKDTP